MRGHRTPVPLSPPTRFLSWKAEALVLGLLWPTSPVGAA